MRKSTIHTAVAAIIATGAAASAGAVAISAVPSGNILYISGSTAIDGGLFAYFLNSVDNFCNAASTAGGIDTYAGTTSGKQFQAVACAAGAGATPTPPDTLIALIKENTAGSLNGITPVANASTVPFPDFTTLDTNCPAGTAVTPTGEQLQTPHACSSTYSLLATPIAPNLGFADVEAAVFGVTAPNTSSISTIDIIFAPAVSLGLYHALQRAQTLPQDDAIADMPNLTTGQLTAIFNGQATSWANLAKAANGDPVFSTNPISFGSSNMSGSGTSAVHICYDGTAFSTAADCQATQGPAVAPASATIYVCQRGQSSGSERSAQIFWGNINCAGGVNAFSLPTKPGGTCSTDGCGWSTTFNTVVNFAGNGTGDLLSCLEAKDEQGELAIGFASVDNGFGPYQSNVARKDFRYVKVDGVVPSIENAAANRYRDWSQSTGYAPVSGRANFPTGVAANLLTAITSATTQIGSVGSIKALNPALIYTAPAFDGGFLNIPGNTASVPNHATDTLTTFQANPVNSYTKTAGAGPNNCQTPYAASGAPDIGNPPAWATP